MKIEKLRLRCAYGYFGIPESIAGVFSKTEESRIEDSEICEVHGNAGAGEEQG